MPNYSLVIDSTFQPFTYQELTAPLDRSEAYHEKLAQEYDNLSSQADILEAMGKDDKDSKSGSYSKYKSYSDALRREAEDLYRYGLNVESRRRLSNMRRAYNTDIVPIQNAWNKRVEEAKAQQTAKANNPFLRFSREAANTDIDYYVNNPTGGYDVVNLESVYKTASNAFKNLSKLKREGKLEAIDPYTNAFVREYGIDPNLIVEWQRDPSKSNLLTSIVEQSLSMNGLNSKAFDNSPIKDEARYAAMSAAWDAVGESKEQVMNNYYNQQMLASNLRMNEYKQKKNIDAQEAAGQAIRNEGNIPLFFEKIQSPGEDGKVHEVNALEYRFGDNNSKVLESLIPRLVMNDDKTFIREVKSIGADGKITPKDKYVDIDEFIDNKGNAKNKPLFYRVNSPNGSNNIIMKYGTKSYIIPGERLGNIFGESNVDVERLQELYNKKQELLKRSRELYGNEDAYWNNPKISATIENALNNYGAASVRRASTGIAGSYKMPTFGLTSTNENNLE